MRITFDFKENDGNIEVAITVDGELGHTQRIMVCSGDTDDVWAQSVFNEALQDFLRWSKTRRPSIYAKVHEQFLPVPKPVVNKPVKRVWHGKPGGYRFKGVPRKPRPGG